MLGFQFILAKTFGLIIFQINALEIAGFEYRINEQQK